jgi:hypothetical protein
MTDDQPHYRRIAAAVHDVELLRHRRDELAQSGPGPGSAAALDALERCGEEAGSHAFVALSIAIELLEAWGAVFLKGQILQPLAPFAMLRGSMEGSVVCRWLVDPRATPAERAARGRGAYLDDITERRKAEAAFDAARARAGEPPMAWSVPGKSGARRFREFNAVVRRQRLAVQRLPVTDLFNRYGPGEGMYRLTSGVAHGRRWAMAVAQRGLTGQQLTTTPLTPIELLPSPGWLADTTEMARRLADRALADTNAYYGSVVGDSR